MTGKTKEELLELFRTGTPEESKEAQAEIERRIEKLGKTHDSDCLCVTCQGMTTED